MLSPFDMQRGAALAALGRSAYVSFGFQRIRLGAEPPLVLVLGSVPSNPRAPFIGVLALPESVAESLPEIEPFWEGYSIGTRDEAIEDLFSQLDVMCGPVERLDIFHTLIDAATAAA